MANFVPKDGVLLAGGALVSVVCVVVPVPVPFVFPPVKSHRNMSNYRAASSYGERRMQFTNLELYFQTRH